MLRKLEDEIDKTKINAPSYSELKNLYYAKEIYLSSFL